MRSKKMRLGPAKRKKKRQKAARGPLLLGHMADDVGRIKTLTWGKAFGSGESGFERGEPTSSLQGHANATRGNIRDGGRRNPENVTGSRTWERTKSTSLNPRGLGDSNETQKTKDIPEDGLDCSLRGWEPMPRDTSEDLPAYQAGSTEQLEGKEQGNDKSTPMEADPWFPGYLSQPPHSRIDVGCT